MKMAPVKKSFLASAKTTIREKQWNFHSSFFLAEKAVYVFLAQRTVLTETFDSRYCADPLLMTFKLRLYHIDLIALSRCKFHKIVFSMLFPCTCRFKTRPSPRSKLVMNAGGVHFLQLYRKDKCGGPSILFYGFNNNNASFQREKKGKNLQYFSNFMTSGEGSCITHC